MRFMIPFYLRPKVALKLVGLPFQKAGYQCRANEGLLGKHANCKGQRKRKRGPEECVRPKHANQGLNCVSPITCFCLARPTAPPAPAKQAVVVTAEQKQEVSFAQWTIQAASLVGPPVVQPTWGRAATTPCCPPRPPPKRKRGKNRAAGTTVWGEAGRRMGVVRAPRRKGDLARKTMMRWVHEYRDCRMFSHLVLTGLGDGKMHCISAVPVLFASGAEFNGAQMI